MRWISLAWAACTALACSTSPTAPSTPPQQDLANAPTSIVVSGKTVTLEANVWRDFMPIAPPDGRPLSASLNLRTTDGSAIPATARADAVWILFGSEVWAASSFQERRQGGSAPFYEIVVHDGPKWGPGVNVDVVVRLIVTDGGDGRVHLLRAPNQPIMGAL